MRALVDSELGPGVGFRGGERFVQRILRFEPWAYALFSGFCTLWVALHFYGSLRLQTLYSLSWSFPEAYDEIVTRGVRGPWSAPLDDVFIHFDFARSTAYGYPFQWVVGNGYSSGGTSILYPFVLSIGYLLGWRDLDLMMWAAIVACVCVFALQLAARRLFAGLPRFVSYLAPVAVLSVGGLDWTLFSGMEVALFLALWAGACLAWDEVYRLLSSPTPDAQGLRRAAVLLGIWGMLVVATRPEGAIVVGVFALTILGRGFRGLPGTRLAQITAAAVLPGVAVVVIHAVANYLLTGNATAAGAIVKLELHDPKLTPSEVWHQYLGHLAYEILRTTHYHFGVYPYIGWVVWVLAATACLFRSTRRYALMLWATAVLWLLLTATNGQVRWQNERYVMPAVAWLLLAASLGVGALLTQSIRSRRRLVLRILPGALAVALAGTFAYSQWPRLRWQMWFFGRASRNIFEQHVQAATFLSRHISPVPQRVLLGDAGAIPYVSGLPALDMIGLGGLKGFPIADAARWSPAAAIELVERMPEDQRPDVMAIYPSWWGELPLWFSTRTIARIPARGNTICGGPTKVLYEANWASLKDSALPIGLEPGWRVRDELDIGDVVSEKKHEFELSRRGVGHVNHKLLAHPERPAEGLWDAGRVFASPYTATFTLHGLEPARPLKLLMRLAPAQPATVRLLDDRGELARLPLTPGDTWQHLSLMIPADRVRRDLTITLTTVDLDTTIYHLWAAQTH